MERAYAASWGICAKSSTEHRTAGHLQSSLHAVDRET